MRSQFISRGVDALQRCFLHLADALTGRRPTVGVKFSHQPEPRPAELLWQAEEFERRSPYLRAAKALVMSCIRTACADSQIIGPCGSGGSFAITSDMH